MQKIASMRACNVRTPTEFGVNQRGRDFVVGDLHGQLAMLDALLLAVKFDEKRDRLFSVGDLIDRGMHSAEILQRFTGRPGYFATRGNHEAMLIASDSSLANFQSWQRNGGAWAVSLGLPARLAMAASADRLPLTITLELQDRRRIGIVHAEVPPGRTWDVACAANMTSEDLWDTDARTISASLVWGRRRYLALEALLSDPALNPYSASRRDSVMASAEPVAGVDLIICGHNIVASRHPELLGNTLFIDTGAYEKAGKLTIVEPLTGLYWQCRHQGRGVKASGKPLKVVGSTSGNARPDLN